jgi:hypothetical protein
MTNVVRDKHPITRQDVVSKIERQHRVAELVAEFRPTPSTHRFAVVKKKKNGFHVCGRTGLVETKTFDSLKSILKEEGYTDIRMGAIKTSLRT